MALPQEIKGMREPGLNWAALGVCCKQGWGSEPARSGQGFCSHLDACKKGDITSPKTPPKPPSVEEGRNDACPPQLSLQCSSSLLAQPVHFS